jgi:hypothetical protein
MAGRILSVVLHSTSRNTRTLFLSHPPSSANHRCSNAPAALHSSLSRPSPFTSPPLTHHSAAPHPPLRHSSLPPFVSPHGQPPLVELQLVRLGENSYPGSSPRRAAVAIREVANPSTECRTATRDHLLVEQSSYRSPSHSDTYIRHPSSYYSANCAWNSTSQASRRPTAESPSTTDRHRPLSDPLTFN